MTASRAQVYTLRHMANLNDLRSLALALPPDERVMGGEVADVVSAIVSLAHHGEGLLEAAHSDGARGVAEFLHGKIVDQAKADGHPEPIRGNVPADAPTTGTGNTNAKLEADVARLSSLVENLSSQLSQQTAATDAPAAEPVSDEPVTDGGIEAHA